MSSVNEIVASIQDIEDLDKYRDRSEKELKVLRGIVTTLSELRARQVGFVEDRLAVAIDREQKFMFDYAEVLERAFAKINHDQQRGALNAGNVNLAIDNIGNREAGEVYEADEAQEANDQLNETFYESENADTASSYSGISESVFDAIRLPPYMMDNDGQLDLSPIQPPTPPQFVMSDIEDDDDDEDGIDAIAVNSWFTQNMDWTIFSNDNDQNAIAADRGACIICTDGLVEGRIVNLECNHVVCLGCLYRIFHLMDDEVKGHCPFCRKSIDLNKCNQF